MSLKSGFLLLATLAPLVALHACSESGPAALVQTKAGSASDWPRQQAAKHSTALIEVEIGPNDPEYWAVLHVMIDRGLTIDSDHHMSKAALDCAERQQNDLLRWSRTISDVRVRSAWAFWINHNLDVIADNRAPASVDNDPQARPQDRAETAGDVMVRSLARPPTLNCDPP